MKKSILAALMVALMGTFVFVACGGESSKNSPKAAVNELMDRLVQKDFAAAVDLLQGSENATQEEKEFVAGLFEYSLTENQGIKSYEVVSETIDDKDQTATVKVKYVYNDGEEAGDDFTVVKTEDGWRVSLM